MKIKIPSMNEQLKVVFERSTDDAIKQLKENLNAPVIAGQTEVDESKYSRAHLLDEHHYEAPHSDIVNAYINHFKTCFPEYNSDRKLAQLLGISSDRRVREFRSGEKKIPYGIWRKFLVIQGKAPQDVLPVLAFVCDNTN